MEGVSEFEQLSEERKLLQSKGDLPEWFTTMGWQMFKNKYLHADTFEKQIDIIVNRVGEFCPTNKEYFVSRWKEMIMDNHMYLATPVLANTGTDRGLSVSCSGGYIRNSISGFYESLHESAMLSKTGHGTSNYLGDIIPRGTKIAEGGTANGVLPIFKMFTQASIDVSQGSVRRGAWAGYIEPEHGDFDELVSHIKNNPDSANIGWCITDEFIEGLNSGYSDYQSRYAKTQHLKMLTGKGYYHFIDKVNRNRPQMYKDLNLTVKGSNLCVAPETLVLTDKGYENISTLAEFEKVNVWNGEEYSEVNVRKTGVNQKLIKVVTDLGQDIECTEYHKFYVQNEYGKKPVLKAAIDLDIDDKLIKFDLPIIEGEKELVKPYQNGFFSGDGCVVKGKSRIYLYHEKMDLEHLFSLSSRVYQPDVKRIYGNESNLKDKYFVPDSTYTIKSRLDWLAGYMDADGCIYRNGASEQLVATSVERNFLKEIQLMLQTLGVQSKIRLFAEEGYRKLPANDGTGELKDFYCQEAFRLLITSNGLYKLHQLGIEFNRLKVKGNKPQRDANQFVKVVSVTDEGRVDDTYCFTEPKRHMGMFNGILTGNCDEITLFSDENHTFTCVIGGLVAKNYDSWKDTDAAYCCAVFLDCLVSEYIEEAGKKSGLEKAVRFTEKGRAIGVGLTGLHSLFQSKMLPFGSFEAHMLNTEISKHIQDETLRASQWMAKEWGEPEWCKGYGVRNTHRTAYAPNTSSSLIFGSESQGITPWYGNAYNEGSASGGMFRVNPQFIEMLKRYEQYSDDVINSVLDNSGSCQHLEFLSDDEKEVFKTFFEIDMMDVLRLAEHRQKHNCQGQSLNLAFDANESEEYISEVHKKAFESEWIHGLYYVRSQAGVAASRGTCSACES